MKKYVKPELFYENYELSQHIAACHWDLNSADRGSCTAEGEWRGQSWILFNNSGDGCNLYDLDWLPLVCERLSVDDWRLINS